MKNFKRFTNSDCICDCLSVQKSCSVRVSNSILAPCILGSGALDWSGVKFRSGKNSYYICRFSLFDICYIMNLGTTQTMLSNQTDPFTMIMHVIQYAPADLNGVLYSVYCIGH